MKLITLKSLKLKVKLKGGLLEDLDAKSQSIKRKFDQTDLKEISSLTNALIAAANKEKISKENFKQLSTFVNLDELWNYQFM